MERNGMVQGDKTRINFFENDEFEILTDEGFKDFSGVMVSTRETFILELKSGDEIRCTSNHRVLTKKSGWKEISELTHFDSVRVKNGFSKLKSVTPTGTVEDVYDLTDVRDTSAYFTGGIYSHNCALLYLDEVAFIENDMEFWESTYPAVAQSETSRVIMTSTPKGQRGLFYKTWCESESDEYGVSNGFHRVKVTWEEVPTYTKSPSWYERTVKRLGEARFMQEFGCSFKGSVGTLIASKTIENMVSTNPKQEPDEWTKIYHPYDPQNRYIAIADVGGGTGGDYSVCRVIDVSHYPYRTVALYRNNEISPMLFPYVIVSMCEAYGSCPVLVEGNNDMGGQALTVLWYDLEYEGTLRTSSDKNKGTGTKIGGGKTSRPGIRTNQRTRSIGCSNMKSMIEKGFLHIDDLETIYELGNFILISDKYQADVGCNDDCVMTLVIFAWLCKQDWFQEEYGKNISTEMYQKETNEGNFRLPLAGGVQYAETPAETTIATSYGNVPVADPTMGFSEWAGS